MSQDDSLQIVPDSEIPELLACLKPQIPMSIHAYYFIVTAVKWKKKVPEMDVGVLAPVEGWKSGAVFIYFQGFGKQFICTTYKWTKEGGELLSKALLKTKRFSWNECEILFSGLTQEVWSIVEHMLPKILQRRTEYVIDKIFWLPAEDVAKFKIDVPEGLHLGYLKEEHAETVDNFWPYKSEGSKELIAMMTWVNFGKGLFRPDGSLVAWALHWFYGGLGVVHTMEEERRKGCGKAVVQSVCKEMGSQGLDVHFAVVPGNTIGEAFFESLGFKHAFDSVWAYTIEKK